MQRVRLTKTRDYVTTVELNNGDTYLSDASWATSDGYVVHRTTRWLSYGGREDHRLGDHMQKGVQYWVKRKSGYHMACETLRDAREEIAYLRETGR